MIDALDECKDRQALLAILGDIASWKTQKLHVLVTSRKEKDIGDKFASLGDLKAVCIQSALVNDDIRAYIHTRLQTDQKLSRWHAVNVKQEIETTLMAKAGGM